MKKVFLLSFLVIAVQYSNIAQTHFVFSRPENTLEIQGILGRLILQEAYSKLGIDFEFKDAPIERSLVMANDGLTDGTFLRIAGLEKTYPHLIQVQFPLQYMEVVAFTKGDDLIIENWQSLEPYRIGIPRGFKIAEIMTEGMEVVQIKTADSGIQMLELNWLDVVIDLKISQMRIEYLRYTDIKMHEPPLSRVPLYHYLYFDHRAIANELETILKSMEESGEIDIIKQKAESELNRMLNL